MIEPIGGEIFCGVFNDRYFFFRSEILHKTGDQIGSDRGVSRFSDRPLLSIAAADDRGTISMQCHFCNFVSGNWQKRALPYRPFRLEDRFLAAGVPLEHEEITTQGNSQNIIENDP